MLYKKLKEELGENELLLHVDYSENYSNIQPGEIHALTLVMIPFLFSQLIVTLYSRLSGTLDKWDFS